jgi:hypothetical protein
MWFLMPKKKRYKNQWEEYLSPGEPYTGNSPGMDEFISWLLVYCLDASDDEARTSWRAMVIRSPDQAADELRGVMVVADDPPPDLVPVMKQYGSVYLYHWKKHVRVLYSDAEYLEWLRRMVRDFREIAEEMGIDHRAVTAVINNRSSY